MPVVRWTLPRSLETRPHHGKRIFIIYFHLLTILEIIQSIKSNIYLLMNASRREFYRQFQPASAITMLIN